MADVARRKAEIRKVWPVRRQLKVGGCIALVILPLATCLLFVLQTKPAIVPQGLDPAWGKQVVAEVTVNEGLVQFGKAALEYDERYSRSTVELWDSNPPGYVIELIWPGTREPELITSRREGLKVGFSHPEVWGKAWVTPDSHREEEEAAVRLDGWPRNLGEELTLGFAANMWTSNKVPEYIFLEDGWARATRVADIRAYKESGSISEKRDRR